MAYASSNAPEAACTAVPMLTFALFSCYHSTGVNTKQMFGKYHSDFVEIGFNVVIANTDI
jgi:hypothetical protein